MRALNFSSGKPQSETEQIKAIQSQHELLLNQLVEIKSSDAEITLVTNFLNSLSQTGAAIQSPEYRSLLRAFIRYWLGVVNDTTGDLPTIELQPFNKSSVPETSTENVAKAQESDGKEPYPLLRYKHILEDMRDLFLFQVSYQHITVRNIDMLEAELRSVIHGLQQLRQESQTHNLVSSIDEVQSLIGEVLTILYVASDILQRKKTLKETRELYRILGELPSLLSRVVSCFDADEEKLKEITNAGNYRGQANQTA